MPNVSPKRKEYFPHKGKRKVSFILESLLVATVLSLFIVGITFVLVPSTTTVKTLLSATSVTLIYPAVYSVARRSEPHSKLGLKTSGPTNDSNTTQQRTHPNPASNEKESDE